MNNRPNCQARITGDEYHCYKCGLVWDINDQDPPKCKTAIIVQPPVPVHEIKIDINIERNKIKEILKK